MTRHWIPCGHVLIAGPANCGRSSLFNSLTGCPLSPVEPRPGTTTQPITGIRDAGEAQICFWDTPPLERGVDPALLDGADVILLVLDARNRGTDLDLPHVAEFLGQTRDKPLLLALGHGDHVPRNLREPLAAQIALRSPSLGTVTVCPPLGEGVSRLLSRVTALLPLRERLFPRGITSLHSGRFLAAQRIRAVVYRILSEDVADGTAVQVEEYNRREDRLYIRANLLVASVLDKGTVIGRKGQTLGRIQQESGDALSGTLGIPVQVEAWAKVRENWPYNPRDLMEFGYDA